MKTEINNRRVDINAVNIGTQRQVRLSLAGEQSIADVMELLRPRLQMSGTLQIRREGDLIPLENGWTVGDVLSSGDRLIVEPTVDLIGEGNRMGSGLAGGSVRDATEKEEDAFRTAAARISQDAVSPDSAKFLSHARQPQGE